MVNRIQIIERSPWDISSAVSELNHLWSGVVQWLAQFGLGLVVLMLVGMIAKLAIIELRRILNHRMNPLLIDVVARTKMESKEKMFDARRKYKNASSNP